MHFDKALAVRPDDADAHRNLAVALTNRGETEEALAHSDQAIALNPDYPEVGT